MTDKVLSGLQCDFEEMVEAYNSSADQWIGRGGLKLIAEVRRLRALDTKRSRAMTALEKRIEDLHEENMRLKRKLELNGVSV